jgi:putative transposase
LNTYFVTAGTWQHRNLFQSDRLARLLLDTLSRYSHQRKFLLHEFVIMPNHIHLLLTPGPGLTLERIMQFIKGGFSYRVKKELGLHCEIWERGYVDHRIRDESDYEHHREYIEQNPIEARLANSLEGYPYSSSYPGMELDPAPQELKPSLLHTA